jgi:hypothetical protein
MTDYSTIAKLMLGAMFAILAILIAVALANEARQDETADTWGQWDGNDDDE